MKTRIGKSLIPVLRMAVVVLALAPAFSMGCEGRGGDRTPGGSIDLKLQATVPLQLDGFTLSTPLLYPDVERERVYIAAGNSNSIFSSGIDGKLVLEVEPRSVPEGADGIAAFCYAEGDFFFHSAGGNKAVRRPTTRLFQLTGGGRIREQDIPDEILEDVIDLGVMTYLGDGRLMIETKPKGPFTIFDFISGKGERFPSEYSPRGRTQFVLSDHGARQILVARRADDYSVFFLSYSSEGRYIGVRYVQRRELFAAAATWKGTHLLQYASGEIDEYDELYKRYKTIDLNEIGRKKYSMFLWFTVVGDLGYVIGVKGESQNPEGYDLLVITLSIV